MATNITHEKVAQLQESLGQAQSAGDKDGEIDALLQIGLLLVNDDPSGAHMHFKLAERVMTSARKRDRLHEAIGGQGRAMRRRQRFQEAIELFSQAAEAASAAQNKTAEAGWKLRQASALRSIEDLVGAKQAIAEVEQILRPESPEISIFSYMGRVNFADKDEVSVLAELEGQIGLTLHAENNEDDAEDHYASALHFAHEAQDDDRISIWATCLGNALSRRRSYTEAIGYYESAISASQSIGAEASTMNAAIQLSTTMVLAYRFEEGGDKLFAIAQQVSNLQARRAILDRSLSLFEHSPNYQKVIQAATAIEALADSLPLEPDYLAGISSRRNRAETIKDNPPTKPPEGPTPVDLFLVESMGEVTRTGDLDLAKKVAHLICDVNLGLQFAGGENWKRMIQGDILSYAGLDYRALTEVFAMLLTNDDLQSAFELLQRYKGPGFSMSVVRHFQATGAPCPEAEEYLKALETLASQVDKLAGPAAPDYMLAINAVRCAGEAVLEAGELLRESDSILQARMGGVVRANDLIDALPSIDGVAIIDFLMGPDSTLGLVMLRDGNNVRLVPLINEDFTAEHGQQLMEVYASVNLPKSFGGPQSVALDQISKILHDRFFCSLVQQLSKMRITQLIVIPDMLTRFLPIHLSRVCGQEIDIPGIETDQAEYLCEVMPIELAPCLQAVAASQIYRRPTNISHVAAFADPKGDLLAARVTFEGLAEKIADSAGYDLRLGQDATKKALSDALEEADLVLVGTHGEYSVAHPEESYLVLSDEPWTLSDMIDQPELARNPLLVLGACEIGAPVATPNDHVAYGIPGALIAAGGSSVLANLWPVEDISFGYLMERFLVYLAHPGYRPSAALFRAVRDMRHRLGRDEALAICQRHIDMLEEHVAEARLIIAAENLKEWIEETDAENPFADPMFWAATIIIGNGWQLPSRGIVGLPTEGPELFLKQMSADKLLQEWKLKPAMEMAREIAAVTDGVFRARALTTLALGMLRSADLTTMQRVSRKARRIAVAAERIAHAEQDQDLIERVALVNKYLEGK